MKIVLASASPRRRELLQVMGITDFQVRPADVDETVPAGLSPEETVKYLSLIKARACPAAEDELVIASDTLVYLDGTALGKPESRAHAIEMLTALSGRHHQVATGVCLKLGNRELSHCETTDVYFRSLSPQEIESYVDTGEPMDKAGAYGIQGRGSLLVERIDGDYFTVMGLCVCKLGTMLRQFGVELF